MGGIYVSPSPKRGRPPRCAPARAQKETPYFIVKADPCVPFLDTCPKTVVPFLDTLALAWCGKANEYACSAVGIACASSGCVKITTDQDGQRYVALSFTVRAYAQGGGYWAIAIGDERLPWLTADDVRLYASTL